MGRNIPKEVDVRTSFEQHPVPTVDWCDVARVTIDMLPDVALLEIFDFYVDGARINAWYTLVHVCRNWRHVVFGSPHRLDLRLHCTARTPVRMTLDVWPLLPIVVWNNGHGMWGVDNIIAALEHHNRICRIDLWPVPSSQLETVLGAMQQPFPTLTDLQLMFQDETALVVSDLFLGGSAPHLQTLILDSIPFPTLPKLLLSATHLVDLRLWRIPRSGYFSPVVMATSLAAMTRLRRLLIRFESPRSRPDRNSQHPPPSTRILLPVLTDLNFKGVCEYMEDLVARINAPLLDKLEITFFNRLIFDNPQLAQFISRTPAFKTHDEARVIFSDWNVSVTLPQASDGALELEIPCEQSDWQLSSLAQVCSSSFPQALIFAVERLYIYDDGSCDWQDDIDNSQWLEFFRPFTTVNVLYISSEFTTSIALGLQKLVKLRLTRVLPTLKTLFLEDTLLSEPVREAIAQFVAARQHASRPITISRWEREEDE